MPAYFNRCVPTDLIQLLNGPLCWLKAEVLGSWGQDYQAHLQTRKREGLSGRIQLYLGSESPLSIDSAPPGYKLTVGKGVNRTKASWMDTLLSSAELAQLEPDIRSYLSGLMLNTTFTQGEAWIHAGLSRRYGLFWKPSDPVLILDTESRVGFSSQQEQDSFKARLGQGTDWSNQMDALGLLTDNSLALVEVKESSISLISAAQQLLCYHALFTEALANGSLSPSAVQGWIKRKQDVGLLPKAVYPLHHRVLTPVIAIPDPNPSWLSNWRTQLDPLSQQYPQLTGLRLWRLSANGEILQEAII